MCDSFFGSMGYNGQTAAIILEERQELSECFQNFLFYLQKKFLIKLLMSKLKTSFILFVFRCNWQQ